MEPMEPNIEQNEQKMSKLFCCINCYYNTSRKLNYERHMESDKHKKKSVEPKIYSMEPNVEQIEQIEQNVKFKPLIFQPVTGNHNYNKPDS